MLSQTLSIVNYFKPILSKYIANIINNFSNYYLNNSENLIRYYKSKNGGVNLNKLKRSKSNRVFSGVCGGLGEYFNIDPTIVRIVWVLLGLPSFGTTFVVYLICSFVIPEDDGIIHSDDYNEKFRNNTPLLIGGGLIIWGSFLLAKILFPWFTIRLASLWRFWPVLLILLGIYILINQRDK